MNRIKEVRKKKGLSLQQVADAVGLGNNTISRYETGKREPKLETWQKLADFFNVSVPYLQGTDDKTVIKKISSEDLIQELIDRKVLEPILVGTYEDFDLVPKYQLRNQKIKYDNVFLLHKHESRQLNSD